MQLMSWMIGRLGSRFGLYFEPYRRRVMHSAMGRFLDEPLDLAVGLVQPDGTQRVLPFTTDTDLEGVELLSNCEQFERMNSITFAGYCEAYRLRLELNIHSAFYPQNERLCLMPAFYFEVRVSPIEGFRGVEPVGPTPDRVRLFIRLRRPGTQIRVSDDTIDLSYDVALPGGRPAAKVAARERLVSLNPGCMVCREGEGEGVGGGLMCDLPVTRSGSGVKWRLVWAAHVADPVMTVRPNGENQAARFRYLDHWADVEAVTSEAVATRDERLALSRRFEKLLAQALLDASQRHLTNQSFQNFLSNTFWCRVEPNAFSAEGGENAAARGGEWFSVWDGSEQHHSAVDVEYNNAIFYLSLWPRLLKLQLRQWGRRVTDHEASGALVVPRDLGRGLEATREAFAYPMPVETNSDFLLLLETYTRWTGDTALGRELMEVVVGLSRHLAWTDRDRSGFPSAGMANTLVEAGPAARYARKQTYLAIKRVAALRAAAALLHRTGHIDDARKCDALVDRDIRRIEAAAWLGDHYAVAVDRSAVELVDPDSDEPLAFDHLPGWDAYSISTGNGLLLPEMIGQPPLLDPQRLAVDVYRANRECQGRYGDGHTSAEPNNGRVSQNLWRDLLARYLHLSGESSAQDYWDLQVMSNTHEQSMGFTDTHIQSNLCNYPRGVVALGYFLATPRLVIDRLSPGVTGVYITVNPDRHTPQRWPLLPLADWQAGKIPVCVVDDHGKVFIEAPTDPVIIHGRENDPGESISGLELIG